MKSVGVFALLGAVDACTHFKMDYSNSSFQISVRNMDLGGGLDWIVHSFPRGLRSEVLGTKWISKFGYVGFTPRSAEIIRKRFDLDKLDLGLLAARDVVSDGLNEHGLSCAFQTLEDAQFQPYNVLHPQKNIFSWSFCKWALENYKSVEEVQEALPSYNFFLNTAVHFVLADAGKKMVVVEFLDKKQVVIEDHNDGIETFGIMTNEPRFEWQLQNVKHLEWKQNLARSAVAMPGNWYPDERFLRTHLVKKGIEASKQPKTYREAVARAVAVINTVTVPMGDIPGTDSEPSGGEGLGDHTQWSVVRDHVNAIFYLRSESNPSFRRIALSELELAEGAEIGTMEIESDPWFLDVSASLRPSTLV